MKVPASVFQKSRCRFIAALLAVSAGASVPSLMAEVRVFTDVQGRQIEAELIEVTADQAKIRRKAGGEFALPLERLSPADREYVAKWAEERRTTLAAKTPKPGETLTFEFPDLPKDFRGQPAAFKVRIPDGYDPAKPAPLMIFLGGGDGGNEPGAAVGLTRGEFVCAALPYPDNGRNPAQANMVGDFENVWKYWKPMLEKLTEAVPNLDPRLRVIGGFSNGGHAIDGVLGEEEFTRFFSAYFLIDGGGALPSRYRDAKGKHCYVAWGTKSPNAPNSEEVVRRARRAGMEVVESPMEDVGHAFPETEKTKVIAWLYDTVIPLAKAAAE
ncbi:MAG: hypothetical protein JNK37_21285 [Verrucomicrobiales bacterium]|nr:hypothetical protein [Verrucomicrobiales bacterium]